MSYEHLLPIEVDGKPVFYLDLSAIPYYSAIRRAQLHSCEMQQARHVLAHMTLLCLLPERART